MIEKTLIVLAVVGVGVLLAHFALVWIYTASRMVTLGILRTLDKELSSGQEEEDNEEEGAEGFQETE